jgi:hypothetical protein
MLAEKNNAERFLASLGMTVVVIPSEARNLFRVSASL